MIVRTNVQKLDAKQNHVPVKYSLGAASHFRLRENSILNSKPPTRPYPERIPIFLPKTSRGHPRPSRSCLYPMRPHNNVHLSTAKSKTLSPKTSSVPMCPTGVPWEVCYGEGRDNVSPIQGVLKWRGESPSSPPFPNTILKKPYWPWKRTDESLTPVSKKRRLSSRISLIALFICSASLLRRPLSWLLHATSNIHLTTFPCITHRRISGCDSPDLGRAF